MACRSADPARRYSGQAEITPLRVPPICDLPEPSFGSHARAHAQMAAAINARYIWGLTLFWIVASLAARALWMALASIEKGVGHNRDRRLLKDFTRFLLRYGRSGETHCQRVRPRIIIAG